MRSSVRRVALLLLAAASPAACDAPPTSAAKREIIRPDPAAATSAARFPKPARPVASIVSPVWADESSRDNSGEAAQVMKLADVRPAMTVADIGAGGGYYTVRLSPRVGPKGLVYAQDITPRYLEALRGRVRQAGLANIGFVQGGPDNPNLPENSIDLAFMVHMYHEIEQPFGLLWHLHASLKPGARVAIVDIDRSPAEHGTPVALLNCELAAVGYAPVAFHDLGDKGGGYLAIFQSAAPRPAPERIRPCRASGKPVESVRAR